jgi:hypothetical protein
MIQSRSGLKLPIVMEIDGGELIDSIEQAVDAIMKASDAHAENIELSDGGEIEEFIIACDALNVGRMLWRFREEFGVELAKELEPELSRLLCQKRGYEREDFELALEATAERPRCPFGIDPLRFAFVRAKSKPIQVIHPEIQDSLSQTILAMAIHLKHLNQGRPVLLPIEQLRVLLGCRKLIVGGAVRKLLKHEVLVEIGTKAHTGKAREFRVDAREGVDYRLA